MSDFTTKAQTLSDLMNEPELSNEDLMAIYGGSGGFGAWVGTVSDYAGAGAGLGAAGGFFAGGPAGAGTGAAVGGAIGGAMGAGVATAQALGTSDYTPGPVNEWGGVDAYGFDGFVGLGAGY